jgi:hypothetical protein
MVEPQPAFKESKRRSIFMDGENSQPAALSPVRKWIQKKLTDLLPSNSSVIYSHTNAALFTEWTGMTHMGLKETWALEAGTGATTTSCNAFLGMLVRKIREAGGLPVDRPFPSFHLPKAGGPAWHWAGDQTQDPQSGDFFQIGTPGQDLAHSEKGGTFKHVGAIIEVNYIIWITAEGGQGGPRSQYDAIKRKLQIRPAGLMGWINVDEFFAGWNGPKL